MILRSIEKYSPNKKQEILIIFDYMIADMLINKKLNPIVTELLKKNQIFLLFLSRSLISLYQKILD